jgi:hypothetical protein
LQIFPDKESAKTRIRICLKNGVWDTQGFLRQKIQGLLSHPGGKKAQVIDHSTLDLEVDYDALETFLELLILALDSETVGILEKKILIEKLGGWFDV